MNIPSLLKKILNPVSRTETSKNAKETVMSLQQIQNTIKMWNSVFIWGIISILYATTLSLSAAPFVDNNDGTITDIGKGLIWQKCANNLSGTTCGTGGTNQLTWANALTYCNGLSLTGRTWRLPSVTELRSILDHSVGASPLINGTYFPATPTQYFWTSTTYKLLTVNAWAINFQSGFTSGSNSKATTFYVRCVTSAP